MTVEEGQEEDIEDQVGPEAGKESHCALHLEDD